MGISTDATKKNSTFAILKLEVRNKKLEIRSWKLEVGNKKLEVGS